MDEEVLRTQESKDKDRVAWIKLEYKKKKSEEDGEDEVIEFGWLKIEKLDDKNFLVEIRNDDGVIVPPVMVKAKFVYQEKWQKYFFKFIKDQIKNDVEFAQWLTNLQKVVTKKIAELNAASRKRRVSKFEVLSKNMVSNSSL